MDRTCNTCDSPLILGQNWTEGAAKSFNYLCRACVSEQSRKWAATHKDHLAAKQRVRRATYTPEQHERDLKSCRRSNQKRAADKKVERERTTPKERHDARLILPTTTRGPQSAEHVARRNAALRLRLATEPRICADPSCGATFFRTSPSQKYCSGQCWNRKARKKREKLHRISVSPTLYAKLVEIHGDTCCICRADSGGNGRGDRLAVDHDHTTGEIRGLLCHKCNTAIGLFQDNPQVVIRAAEYLASHK